MNSVRNAYLNEDECAEQYERMEKRAIEQEKTFQKWVSAVKGKV